MALSPSDHGKDIQNFIKKITSAVVALAQFHKDFSVFQKKNTVPVRQKDGENPVKADGKLYVIDGGLSKAYQAKTGIAGYTLIFNSHYLALAQHHDYISHPLSKPESDDMPTLQITQKMDKRILVSDTDAGKKLSQRIEELRLLVKAYENGSFVERAIAAYPKTIQSLHMETMEIVR